MRRLTGPTLAALAAAAALTAACGEGSFTAPASAPRPPARVLAADGGGSSRLVACAAPASEERVTGIIGPLGGVIRLGNAALDVPAGAVLEATLFELVAPATEVVELEVHAVGLSSFLFEKPVTVTLDYARCGADALPADAEGEAVYIDRDPYVVLEHMGGVVDRDAQTVTFGTGHLSGYAVAF